MIVIPDLVGDPENMDSRLRGNDNKNLRNHRNHRLNLLKFPYKA